MNNQLVETIKQYSYADIERLRSLLEELSVEKRKNNAEEPSIASFIFEYEEYVKNSFSAAYLRSVKLSLKQLADYFGSESSLESIKVLELEKFKSVLYKRAPGGASVYLRTLKAAFNKAVDWELIQTSPFTKIKIKKIQKNKPAFINRAELNKILECTKKEELKNIFIFSFETGCRPCEILQLRWSAIDLALKIITVGDKKLITKNKKCRIIPMTQNVQKLLLKKQELRSEENGYVFCKENGFPYNRDYVSRAFKKARRAAELNEEIHWYSLRHSNATHLGLAGTPISVIKDLLGHSSIMVTEIYTHSNLGSLMKAVNTLNNINGS